LKGVLKQIQAVMEKIGCIKPMKNFSEGSFYPSIDPMSRSLKGDKQNENQM
jgi:hypothetical protein